MAEPGVYLEKLSAFSRMLRLQGLAVSPKETEDASRMLVELGFADREQVKTCLRTVYAKTREEQLTFDKTFDGFFISEEAMRRQAKEQMEREKELQQHRQEAEEELQLNGKPMDLDEKQRETYAAMPEEARQRLRSFMEKYRGTAERNPKLYGEFIHSVFARAILEQQMLMENAGLGGEELDPDIGILYRDISDFQDTQIPKAIEIIQKIARQINGELSARRRSGAHSGKLDFRKTIRKGLETGGSFYRLKYRKKRAHRKSLVILCDVSGSMVQFSEFALRFIQSLNQVSDNSRGFLFSETMVEADAFKLQNMDRPGYGFAAAMPDKTRCTGQRCNASDLVGHQVHRPAPGYGGAAGGQAAVRQGDLAEPHSGEQMALHKEYSDYGIYLHHGALLHPAGTGGGLPQAGINRKNMYR